MFISPHIKDLWIAIDDLNQRQVIEFALCQFMGHSQRVVQDKLRGKRPFVSIAEKQSYETKFNEVYQQLLEPVQV